MTNLQAAIKKFPPGTHVKVKPKVLKAAVYNNEAWAATYRHSETALIVVVDHVQYRDSDDDIYVCLCAPCIHGKDATGWFPIDAIILDK